jgi:uncharacterized protein (DUF433 family)
MFTKSFTWVEIVQKRNFGNRERRGGRLGVRGERVSAWAILSLKAQPSLVRIILGKLDRAISQLGLKFDY